MRYLILFISLFSTASFAADYVWSGAGFPIPRASSASALCDSFVGSGLYCSTCKVTSVSLSFHSATSASCTPTVFDSQSEQSTTLRSYGMTRNGDSCPAGTEYNEKTGGCEKKEEHKKCQVGSPVRKPIECDFQAGFALCPNYASYDNCEYIGAGNMKCIALDDKTSICLQDWIGTGKETDKPKDDLGGDFDDKEAKDCRKVVDAEGRHLMDCNPTEDPDNSKCGNMPGYVWSGTTCVRDPNSPDNRICDYVDGQLECVNPKDPTQKIDPNSPDHPLNGGNADGNDKNDPQSNGNNNTSQNAHDPLTNQTAHEIGKDLGAKLDETNRLLGEIKDKGVGGGGGGGKGDGDSDAGDGGKLTKPVQGSFDKPISEADTLIEDLKGQSLEFSEKFKKLAKGALDIKLPNSDGKLPVSDFTISSLGGSSSFTLDLGIFSIELTILRSVMLFIAAIIAVLIIFGRGKD
ncbi:hypothetical protein VQ643_09840 [Pseudomonas sp. F1_0610]|uniref:hypothetical protein n=1 Tax=Pseudomonas sp. F1_0610 TaxID=3114284 RepID=UPI0039C01284